MGNSTMMSDEESSQQPLTEAGAPNLMQKLNKIGTRTGDMLSKGKELIFMNLGLSGK